MSGSPGVKSMNLTEAEARPVLVAAGNKARSVQLRKPVLKLKCEKMQRAQDAEDTKGKRSPAALQLSEIASEKIVSPVGKKLNCVATILAHRQQNLSLSASCSSDASSDSSHSRSSTGRVSGRRGEAVTPISKGKLHCVSKEEKIESKEGNWWNVGGDVDGMTIDSAVAKKRCAWVTSYADPLYAAFHDEEWGVPVHDDRKLFELLSFSTALAELTWPAILSKRHTFRDVFLDFNPIDVSKLSEKKIATAASPASLLLSEVKLRSIIENARKICKIIDEFGSFDKYIWGFVNYKPIVGNFRYPRQVPIKTSKADTISKDLVRRGLQGVGQTVIYSFMQAAGITNDHLISCFRYSDCIIIRDKNGSIPSNNDNKPPEDVMKLDLIVRDIDDLSLST